ncbi:carboxypeptidase-like regulatory domain-containing protein, partial [Flavobacteriaceae bacterium]|nr:carboxypeptidase-like regulatory domain-containing protein [Flavobacteriaceae bacterium]
MILTKNKSLKILSVFFAIFMSLCSYGQSMIVKGKVVDEKGVPLIGVTIIEDGINNGAATDFDGNYVLNVQSPDANLAVSYIGFETQIISVKGESTVNIIMVEDLESLEEVQVVAFSKQKKNSVIGS